MTDFKYLTSEEVAQEFRIDAIYAEQTVARWCRNGEFPGAFKVCGEWRIPRESLEKFKKRRAA